MGKDAYVCKGTIRTNGAEKAPCEKGRYGQFDKIKLALNNVKLVEHCWVITREDDENVADAPATPATPPRTPGTMLVELVFGIHGKLSVEASVKRGRDFQFALRLDSGQFLVFVSPEDPKTISSEAFAKRRAKYGPVDLCGDAFRHGALVDSLEKAFRAAGTDRTAKAVVLQQWVAPGCGNIIANEGLHLARVDPTAKAASLGRAEADRLAYWLRAYAMRWYRDGNALQGRCKHW